MLCFPAFTGRNVTSVAGSFVREQPQPTQPKKTPSANIERGRDFPALTAFPSHPLGLASCSLPLTIQAPAATNDFSLAK